ncbi:hypothetical protein NNO_1849 [Hydrogenimonas sp.]|nr:hypothetical protein NNO_1849 [Hydrogenimonas sp.]
MKKSAVLILGALSLFAGEYRYMNGDRPVELYGPVTTVKKHSLGEDILYFKKSDGSEIGISGRILVKFESSDNIRQYLEEYGLKLLKRYDIGDIYLLEAESAQKALEAANLLYGKPDVIFAQPDIVREWSLR